MVGFLVLVMLQTFGSEFLSARFAPKGSLLRMCQNVSLQLVVLYETLRTDATFVWLDSSVLTQMYLQLVLANKGRFTRVAFMQLFPAMRRRVRQHAELLPESFPANFALEWFETAMVA